MATPDPVEARPGSRVLVVPAAGSGSRLGLPVPKVLAPVNGRPMLAWLLDLYASFVERIVVIVSPAAEPAVRAYGDATGAPIAVVVQPSPTGMLDAILLARERVEATRAAHVWISWCDQIAIHPRTVDNLARVSSANASAPLVLPTVMRDDPYIHLERDGRGRITHVRHRREGDSMPARGESDAGLFSLSRHAYLAELPAFAAGVVAGASTGERNFLPFIPWIARRADVVTFPVIDPMEAVGVNTPAEQAAVGAYLASRAPR